MNKTLKAMIYNGLALIFTTILTWDWLLINPVKYILCSCSITTACILCYNNGVYWGIEVMESEFKKILK